jgi:hypothetical protein
MSPRVVIRTGWRRLAALTAAILLVTASAAEAQAARQKRPPRPKELSFGGHLITPTSFGNAVANLERPDGADQALFRVDNNLGPGVGLEASFGLRLQPKLWAEVTGTWTNSELRTRVSDDFESVADTTVTESLTRFTVEGSALWYFRERGATSFFTRTGAGWMRELTGGASLAVDGLVANAGIGMKHWWRDRPRGSFRRLGIRAEFRLNIRSTSLSPMDPVARVGAAGVASFVIGF